MDLKQFKDFLKFIYLTEITVDREAGREREREADSPSREPNVGLDPRTLRSQPEPEAAA